MFHVSDFPERKIFLSVWLHFRKCSEKYFLVFGCMVENAIFLQQQKSKSHRKYIFSPAKQIYNFIPQFRNTNKTQEKKKSYSGQIERRRKRRRTIGFRVEDDRCWGATIAIEDDESGFVIGDDESVLRLRLRSARRRSQTAKSKGEVERRRRTAKSKLNSSALWV